MNTTILSSHLHCMSVSQSLVDIAATFHDLHTLSVVCSQCTLLAFHYTNAEVVICCVHGSVEISFQSHLSFFSYFRWHAETACKSKP